MDNITPESHHINHANSKTIIRQNSPEFGIEFQYNNKFFEKMATIYDKLSNQCKVKYQTVFLSRFDEQNEDGQMIDQIEFFVNLDFK